jgi:hypothetical protein
MAATIPHSEIPSEPHSRSTTSENEVRAATTESACNRLTNCCRAACIAVRELRADARRCFQRAGIEPRYIDTAVVRCLIADRTKVVANPLGYCLAVGRLLQEEAAATADRRRREFERDLANTCSHGFVVERCSECAREREFALELFPSLRQHIPPSLLSPRPEGEPG